MADALAAIEVAAEWEAECPQCGSTRLQMSDIKSAFWQGERLVVVEDIPALTCEACGERFFDDSTVTKLDLLQAGGLPSERFLNVPVFAFGSCPGLRPTEPLEEIA